MAASISTTRATPSKKWMALLRHWLIPFGKSHSPLLLLKVSNIQFDGFFEMRSVTDHIA